MFLILFWSVVEGGEIIAQIAVKIPLFALCFSGQEEKCTALLLLCKFFFCIQDLYFIYILDFVLEHF